MKSSIRVRRAYTINPTAAALVTWLQRETLPSDEPLSTDEGWWWVAYEGTTPIGFAGLKASSDWLETGYLCRAGVLKDHRGKGVQQRLIRAREVKARSLGWHTLLADTTGNPHSGNNLFACGFKMYHPSKPWANANSCYWRKKLKTTQPASETLDV